MTATIQGTLTAMITPFRGGEVDYARLTANALFQIESGIDGLVPVGTTGESPTLSHEEHRLVIEKVVAAAKGAKRRVPVVAGTGSNATSEALELTRHAAHVGADAALMVNPYYNKPTQEGLYRHFMTVADAVALPIILYNIPGRTGVKMEPKTVARLAAHKNIVGVKEATGDLDVASEIAQLCDPAKFIILSGDDSLTLPLMSVGARGVISVLSNLVPQRVKALTEAVLRGDFAGARKVHLQLYPLCKAMFIETNPIPIKTAMSIAGMDTGELRLPMCEPTAATREVLVKALKDHGVTG
ncbi:MAG: 4-hydroxy-tetrahydrodipicolinate synthase [Planctomycetota bacterium]|nr:4-hydroxy-tetrahydrodipicolinate synthase [Planctomycetota bacterium]